MKKIKKRVIILFLIPFFLGACKSRKQKQIDTWRSRLEEFRRKDEVANVNIPCSQIQEFVINIEKYNWVSDEERLKKVAIYAELDRHNVEYLKNRPFYPIKLEKSSIYRAYKSEINSEYPINFDIEIFKRVESIWGYYYREKNKSDLISDGVIEQWEFANKGAAKKALEQIKEVGSLVYFNTTPFFCQIENKLFIFQTRAMAFSYDQEIIYKKFMNEYIKSN
ncbi:conserved protein of unknown function [Tenacibaculum sp. 190524A02b]|uniref:hypothetical protein n=1 Tax=Tenacibaculum vairaonense TaxID=3137860 RepID=UPI0032B26DAD